MSCWLRLVTQPTDPLPPYSLIVTCFQEEADARERDRAARENAAMIDEEWAAARLRWHNILPNEVGWRTVRVFISSTFRDMHGERDSLTRHVFPQLEQLCLPLQIVSAGSQVSHVLRLTQHVFMGIHRESFRWICDGA